MKAIILLVILPLSVFAQDSTYCLPIETARKLVEDAVVKRHQDTIIVELRTAIDVHRAETDSVRASFAAYRRYTLRSEALSQEMIDNMVEQADAWEKAYDRERKKTKWGKWLIPAGVLGGFLLGK